MPVINVVVDLSQEEAQGQRQEVRVPGAAGQLFGQPLLPNSPRCITVETDISPSLREFFGRLLLGVRRGTLTKVRSKAARTSPATGCWKMESGCPATLRNSMLYVVTTESGTKALVPGRCQQSATEHAEKRLGTRVVSIDYLETSLHKEFNNLAILSTAMTGDSS